MDVNNMFLFGFIELLFLVFPFMFGGGVPLGTPAGEEDEFLLCQASDELIAFTYWTGQGEIDPERGPTHQFMANDLWGAFFGEMRQSMKSHVAMEFRLDSEPVRDAMVTVLDQLAWGIFENPTCAALTKLAVRDEAPDQDLIDGTPDVSGFVITRLGDRRGDLEAAWNILVNVDDSISMEVVERDGLKMLQLKGLDAPTPVYMVIKNGYLVLGIGDDFFTTINWEVERETPKASWLQELETKLPVANRSSLGYVNLQHVFSFSREMRESLGGPDPTDFLTQADDIESIQFVTGMDEHGTINRTWLKGEIDDALSLGMFESKPISKEFFRQIPADATGAIATRLSTTEIMNLIRSTIESSGADVGEFDNAISESDRFLGISIEEEILAAIDNFAFVVSNFNVDAPQNGWVLGVRLRDEMSFQDTMLRFSARIEEIAEETGATYSTKEVENTTLHVYDAGQEFLPLRFSWALIGKYLYISFDEESIGRLLEKTQTENNGFHSVSVARMLTLAQELGLGEPYAYAELNAAQIYTFVYPLMTQMGMDQPFIEGGSLTLSQFPKPESICVGIDSNRLAVFKRDDGVELLGRQTLPGSNPIATTAFWLAGAFRSASNPKREWSNRKRIQNYDK
ncbi:MAG: hypothetical protein R3C03_02690 [Pirellulaceae bacterium]